MKPILFLLFASLCALRGQTQAAAEKPNVVFILADDLGWADTTLYGHTEFYKTPHIARLAERGMTFTRAYAASPLCSPTRASILLGQNPARHGITAPNCHLGKVILEATAPTKGNPAQHAVPPVPPTRLKTEHYTLAEALKDAGYGTAHFGKWHLGIEPYSPLEHGFDIDIPHWHGPGPAGSFVAPWKYPDFDPQTPDEHIEDRMAAEAVAYMEKQSAAGQPFFLNYWMFSVHAPFDAKPALIEKYQKTANPDDAQRSPTYAAMIESMDDAVGTLLDAIDRLELADDTIIVFFSDNGGNMYNEVDNTTPTSNRPLRGGKASMWEGGVRVPCVIAWPGKTEPASRNDAVIQSDDFYPSLLEMLAIKAKPDQVFDGVSFVPALEGKPHDRGPIFTYFPHNPPVPDWMPPSVSVHGGDWKLYRIFHAGEDGAHRYQLYNLAADLGEKNDLTAAKPELVKELDTLIENFLTETKAVRPAKNTAFDPAKYKPEDEGKPRIRNKPKPKPAPQGEQMVSGWKVRNSEAAEKAGFVTITAKNPQAFLGIGAGISGPATITVRCRTTTGGPAKIEWLKADVPPEAVRFDLTASAEWQSHTIEIPAKKPLGILRVYLPAQRGSVDLKSIQLMPAGGKTKRWEF